MFEVPLEKMTFEEDTKKKTYALRFSLLALVKDRPGGSSSGSATTIRSRARSTNWIRSSAAT